MTHILVTGGEGQVGQALQKSVMPTGYTFLFPTREAFDLGNPSHRMAYFDQHSIDAVINLAAYTAVDKAEDEGDEAFRINRDAVASLAQKTASLAIPLVHVSTDYVFSGTLDRAYREDDATGPIGVYGRSKEAGEQAVRHYNPNHAIIRTSWVVSPFRNNFIKTMLRLASERDTLSVVSDQFGAPTSAKDLASALLLITQGLMSHNQLARGTFHFSNLGEACWADIAEIVMHHSASLGGPNANIRRISTAEYPTRATRPKNSRLDTSKYETVFKDRPRTWQIAVGEIVGELLQGEKP